MSRSIRYLFLAIVLALSFVSIGVPAHADCPNECKKTVCTNWYEVGEKMPNGKICQKGANPWDIGCCYSYGTYCIDNCPEETNTPVPTLTPTVPPTAVPTATTVPTATAVPTALPSPTATAAPTSTHTPLSGTIGVAGSSFLVYYGPQVGRLAQTLSGTVSGGVPPYAVSVKVRDPENRITTYHTSGAAWQLAPADAHDLNFGTTEKGMWSAWAEIRDNAGHSAVTLPVVWYVEWFATHGIR